MEATEIWGTWGTALHFELIILQVGDGQLERCLCCFLVPLKFYTNQHYNMATKKVGMVSGCVNGERGDRQFGAIRKVSEFSRRH